MNRLYVIETLLNRIEVPSVIHTDQKILFFNNAGLNIFNVDSQAIDKIYDKSLNDVVDEADNVEITDTAYLENGIFVSTIKEKSNNHISYADLRFKDVFKDHSAPMILVDFERGGRIIEANDAACAFYGYSSDEITSMTIDYLNILPLSEIVNEMTQAKTRNRNYFNFTHRIKDGNVRNVEVYSTPINYNGKTVLFSIIHDTTEKKLYEIQLRDMNKRLNKRVALEVIQNKEREKQYQELFDILDEPVFIINLENGIPSRFVYANDSACALAGIAKDILMKTKPMDMIAAYEFLNNSEILYNTNEKKEYKTYMKIGNVGYDIIACRLDTDGNEQLFIIFKPVNL